MRRLWIQLTLAFALVTLLSVATAALFANQQTGTEFRGFLAQSQVQEAGLPATLARYYQANGSWVGVEQLFAGQHGPGGQGMGRGLMRGAAILRLTDAAGRLVYDSRGSAALPLEPGDGTSSTPILIDGTAVGFLTARLSGQTGLTTAAERFLTRVNQALMQAALLGATLGALFGLLLARSLAAPLHRLSSAARQLAQGDLSQRLPLDGPDELAAASQAFNEMADALESAERQRRRMIADVAHELRTPLAVIQGNLQAILDDVYPLEKAEVQTIFDESILLSRLVGDLRELALAEAGQIRLQCQPVDIAALVQQSIAMFSGPASDKGIHLHPSIPDALPSAWADPTRSSQVLHNLLANAVRYTPHNGTITVRVRGESSFDLRIEIEDTGTGMTPDDLRHVFERFWRADSSRSREQGGSGLGLAIAQQLVQAQGGQIGARSHQGQGSCFWFTLPIASAQQIVEQSA